MSMKRNNLEKIKECQMEDIKQYQHFFVTSKLEKSSLKTGLITSCNEVQ